MDGISDPPKYRINVIPSPTFSDYRQSRQDAWVSGKETKLRTIFIAATLAGAFSVGMLAQTSTEPDVSGTWVQSSNGAIKWILAQKDGKMHVQEMNDSRVVGDFTCALSGQECEVKEDGRSEKVMLYYNGSKLVAIRVRGDDATKQRLSVSSDGKTLQVETVPLSASQKAETLTFQRQVEASSNNKS
jgi:hypothetical protein